MITGDGFSCFGHTLEIAVGNSGSGTAFQRIADALRQGETESSGVAGVQLQNLDALGLHTHSLME